jgi:ABC-type multidrug transport system fused ATPase/permease subunit
MLALMNMLCIDSGNIYLDDFEIRQVLPGELRQRCFVAVSQDPLLLPQEDLYFNIDPHKSASDSTLVQTLTAVGLWQSLSSCVTGSSRLNGLVATDAHAVLSTTFAQLPTLSGGQRQLFALARAIVKTKRLRDTGSRPVILLDEVTSSIDSETEETVHSIVESEFSANGHTVIIITHKVGMVLRHLVAQRDIVVRLGDGEVLEVVKQFSPDLLSWDNNPE